VTLDYGIINATFSIWVCLSDLVDCIKIKVLCACRVSINHRHTYDLSNIASYSCCARITIKLATTINLVGADLNRFPSRRRQHLNKNRVTEAYRDVKYWAGLLIGATSVLEALSALMQPSSAHPCSVDTETYLGFWSDCDVQRETCGFPSFGTSFLITSGFRGAEKYKVCCKHRECRPLFHHGGDV
jgi:hypothetical protein